MLLALTVHHRLLRHISLMYIFIHPKTETAKCINAEIKGDTIRGLGVNDINSADVNFTELVYCICGKCTNRVMPSVGKVLN